MALVPVFRADVSEDGTRMTFDAAEREQRQAYTRTLAGRRVDVVIRRHRDRRSDKQNAWWWGKAIPVIAEDRGYDRHEHEELHYALVSLCFGTHVDKLTGLEIPNKRSSELTTVEFSELMEWAVRWAAHEGIRVPLPGEAE